MIGRQTAHTSGVDAYSSATVSSNASDDSLQSIGLKDDNLKFTMKNGRSVNVCLAPSEGYARETRVGSHALGPFYELRTTQITCCGSPTQHDVRCDLSPLIKSIMSDDYSKQVRLSNVGVLKGAHALRLSRDGSDALAVTLRSSPLSERYTLTLPPAAAAAAQVLCSSGTQGDTAWQDLTLAACKDTAALAAAPVGAILYKTDSGSWAALAPGPRGSVLTSSGPGSPPSWLSFDRQ